MYRRDFVRSMHFAVDFTEIFQVEQQCRPLLVPRLSFQAIAQKKSSHTNFVFPQITEAALSETLLKFHSWFLFVRKKSDAERQEDATIHRLN